MSEIDKDVDAMALARARLLAKGFKPMPSERRRREKQVRSVADARSLRTTGRTAQFNFKTREDLKGRVAEAARADGVTIAEWMEGAIEAALRRRR